MLERKIKVNKIMLVFGLLLFLFSGNVLAIYSTTGDVGSKIYPSSIKISNAPKQINYIGQEYQFEVSLEPSDATENEVTWSSSNDNILSIDQNGRAIAKKRGTVKVTATTVNGRTDSVAVTINEIKNSSGEKNVSNLTITNSPKEMLKGEKIVLNVKLNSNVLNNENLIFESSDEGILTVNQNGEVEAIKKGTADIIVKTSDGKKVSTKINVKNVKIFFESNSIDIDKGDTKELIATVESLSEIDVDSVRWTSSSIANATVKPESNIDNKFIAIVTSKEAGKSQIKISVEDETEVVDVKINDVLVDTSLQCPKISYDTTDDSLIKMTIEPATTTVRWDYYISSNKKTGSNATFIKQNSFDNNSMIVINSLYSDAQGKIRIYGSNGYSRDCYTAPFDLDQTKKVTLILRKIII